mgnify:CR=1 FL=1
MQLTVQPSPLVPMLSLLSKIMVYDHEGWYKTESFQKSIDRFRKELDTDYIDILLLHCMVNSEWPDEYKRYMDAYSEAKQKGIIKKVGLSCHDIQHMTISKCTIQCETQDIYCCVSIYYIANDPTSHHKEN